MIGVKKYLQIFIFLEENNRKYWFWIQLNRIVNGKNDSLISFIFFLYFIIDPHKISVRCQYVEYQDEKQSC